MSKPGNSGFLTALIIAILSFVVIFFFFPDVSAKYIGISFKNKGVAENVDLDFEKVLSDVKTKVTDTVTEKVSDTIKNLIGD